MTHLSKRNFIAAAALLAMVSPAWAIDDGMSYTVGKGLASDPKNIGPTGTGITHPVNIPCPDLPNLVQVGDKCVAKYPDIPIRTCWPTGVCQEAYPCDAGSIWLNGRCRQIVSYPGGGSALSSPKCDPGYALLAYPGTWTLVCARDLQAPK